MSEHLVAEQVAKLVVGEEVRRHQGIIGPRGVLDDGDDISEVLVHVDVSLHDASCPLQVQALHSARTPVDVEAQARDARAQAQRQEAEAARRALELAQRGRVAPAR